MLVTVPWAPLIVVALVKLSFAGMVTEIFAHQTPHRPEPLTVTEPTLVTAYSWIVQKSESFTGSTHVIL